MAAKYLPENAWTFGNFLGLRLLYNYTFSIPYRVGLVQVAIAVAGLLLARRYDAVWIFFLAAAAVAAAGIGRWALPVWLQSSILLIAQFPWRLLIIVSLSLALFTGGVVLRIRSRLTRLFVAGLLAVLVIVTNAPRLRWMESLPSDTGANPLAAVAQFEDETGALGTSSSAEFRPRWADSSQLIPDPAAGPGTAQVALLAGSNYGLAARAVDGSGGPLRFTTFYFPGWEVTLDGSRVLQTHPSTSLGLLTVDLPPGHHEFELVWRGTEVQRIAGLITLMTLAGLVLLYGLRKQERHLAIAPAALLVCGLLASFSRPVSQPVQSPIQKTGTSEVTFLGYRSDEMPGAEQLLLYPYWYVRQTPSAAFRTRWQLLDGGGRIVSQIESRPYFNTLDASNWPPGTLVDDAYGLPLPPGTPAGVYRLALQLRAADGAWQPPAVLGDVTLRRGSSPEPPPQAPLKAQFGPSIRLVGFDAAGARSAATASAPAKVRVTDVLNYTLFWRALGPVDVNYHGFVHLVDHLGRPLVQHDALLGGTFATPRLWDAYHMYSDSYRLRIPESAVSGLYWPRVGLYEYKTQNRLPVTDTATGTASDYYELPPVKVLGRQEARPQNRAEARFGTVVSLLGYDLSLPPEGARPGSQLTLTLYYRSEIPTGNNYTRFAHLFSPELGMASQNDNLPQAGQNPTWSWIPGELIADRVELKIAPDVRPGRYHVQVGFYDNERGGARLPATDGAGHALPDAQVNLVTIQVGS